MFSRGGGLSKLSRICFCLETCHGHDSIAAESPQHASSPHLLRTFTHWSALLQDIDEKAEEAYKKMEDAFRVQLGLLPEGVTAS